MGNGNRDKWDIILAIIQVALLPAFGVLNVMIDRNADILRTVQMNKVRVMTTVDMVQGELKNHEVRSLNERELRSRYHHQELRSCLTCNDGPARVPGGQGKTVSLGAPPKSDPPDLTVL